MELDILTPKNNMVNFNCSFDKNDYTAAKE